MILRGKVRSGMGNFSYWMDKLESYYTTKTGRRLYPGTLNIELEDDFILPDEACIRLEAREYGGRVSVSILPCAIFGRVAFILRTDQNASGEGDHPLNIIEVAAEVRLRDEYGLEDGDIVEIEA